MEREIEGRTVYLAQSVSENPKHPLSSSPAPPPPDARGRSEALTHRNPAWNMYIRGAPGLAYLEVVKMFSFFRDT